MTCQRSFRNLSDLTNKFKGEREVQVAPLLDHRFLLNWTVKKYQLSMLSLNIYCLSHQANQTKFKKYYIKFKASPILRDKDRNDRVVKIMIRLKCSFLLIFRWRKHHNLILSVNDYNLFLIQIHLLYRIILIFFII